MTNFYYSLPIAFLLLSSQTFSANNAATYQNIDREREQAILKIRNGDVKKGLSELKRLLQSNPNDQRLIADYILVSRQQKTFDLSDLNLANQINFSTYPDYAQLETISAYRDLKQFDVALDIINGFLKRNNDIQLRVLKAVLLAENQQAKFAENQLKSIDIKKLNVEQQVQVAYAYRIIGLPTQALATVQFAKQSQPNSSTVQQEYLFSLLENGSYQQVLNLIKENNAIDPEHKIYDEAYLGDFAQRINEAIKNQKYLSRQGETDVESFIMLDSILQEGENFLKQLSSNSTIYLKFHYNYLYALSYRGRDVEVLELVKTLNIDINVMPAYVRHAVADSYLALKQPNQAEMIYKSLLKEKNYADMAVYTFLYYSLIEQEKYKEAKKLIKDIDKLIPTFQYSQAKGADKKVHPDRAEYIALKETASAYANRLDLAEKNLNEIVAKSPNNSDYLNLLAKIQRWRDKPQQAEQTLSRLNGIRPESKVTKINSMLNAQALGDIQAWRLKNDDLSIYYPTDTSVVKSNKELEDRKRPLISHQTRFSKSEANQDKVLESLKGSKDLDTTTRIYSPWFKDNYRVITEYSDRQGKYRAGDLKDERVAIGAQWESKRKSATMMFSQHVDDSSRTGFSLDWNHQLNDHWFYSLNFDSQAAIPLQAMKLGEKGEAYAIGVNWKQNESRSIGIGYQVTDISDGNLKQELSMNYKQNLFMGPHFTTSGAINSYYGHNDLDQTSYFSPKNSYGLSASLIHDWVTWRSYEKSLTQKMMISGGVYNQTNYETKPVVDLQYQHKWQISRLWSLNYGIGWGMHPYDGEKEEQIYGNFGFEGRF